MSIIRPGNQEPADTRNSFTFGQRVGLVFITQMAFISLFAAVGLLGYIGVKASRRLRRGQTSWPNSILIFLVSLLVADVCQAIGSILDIRWIELAGVLEGPYCSTQAAFKQIGDTAVALNTLAIAVQTALHIIFRGPGRESSRTPKIVLLAVGFIWIFVALMVGVGVAVHNSQPEPLYGNTKWWCWIRNPPYLSLGIGLEYGWMWLAALASTILYSWMALVLIQRHRAGSDNASIASGASAELHKIALQMLCYPIIYTITVAPISICRFLQFTKHVIPFEATAFSAIVLASSGALNVLLYAFTRPNIFPSDDDDNRSVRSAQGMIENGLPAEPVSAARGPNQWTSNVNGGSNYHDQWPSQGESATMRSRGPSQHPSSNGLSDDF